MFDRTDVLKLVRTFNIGYNLKVKIKNDHQKFSNNYC